MNTSFWSKHGSTILTCAGAIGTVGTAVLTAKCTPKAMEVLEAAREGKGEELTKIEIVKKATPAYIPAIAVGASTVACIFGANRLSKQQIAAIASAYAFLATSYNKYKDKVRDLYGYEANSQVSEEIAKDDYEPIDEEPSEDEALFYDMNCNQYFVAKKDDVIHKTLTDDGLECYIITTPYDIPWWRS